MKNKLLLFPLIMIILFSACVEQDLPEKSGAINGQVFNFMTQSGEENIKLFLISKDAEIDTITYDNAKLIVDSTMTDYEGKYIFQDIGPGSYAVYPKAENQTFRHDTASHPFEFEIRNMDEYTINFELTPPIILGGSYTVDIRITHQLNNDDAKWIYISRKYWDVFMPSYTTPTGIETSMIDYRDRITSNDFSYGFTAVFYTLENTHRYQFGDHIFYISFSIANTPEYSSWEYDCYDEKLTRIE